MALNDRDFREIRLRLGWSLSEMARRMGCHQKLILRWESNHEEPDQEMIRHYEAILSQIDEHSENIRQQPLAESLLKDSHLQQVSREEVLAWEKLTNSKSDDDE